MPNYDIIGAERLGFARAGGGELAARRFNQDSHTAAHAITDQPIA